MRSARPAFACLLLALLFFVTVETGTAQRKHSKTIDVPVNVSNYGLTKEKLNEANVETIGKTLVDSYASDLNISSQNMKKGKIYTDGTWWMAEFKQSYNGIEVEGSDIGFTIGKTGNIISLGSTTFDDITSATTPSILQQDALERVKQDMGGTSFSVYGETKLVIYPEKLENNKYKYNLAWRIELDRLDPLSSTHKYFVNAVTGEILYKIDMGRYLESEKDIDGQQINKNSQPPLNGVQMTKHEKSARAPSGAASCPSITTSSMPDGQVGSSYYAEVHESGGTPPYDWSYDPSYPPPPGLTGGYSYPGDYAYFTGYPTQAGTFTTMLYVQEAGGCQVSRTYTIKICPQITPQTSYPRGVVGQYYSITFSASGGAYPYTFDPVGTFPSGLTYSNGTLSGYPSVSGPFDITLLVTDANGCTGVGSFTLYVDCPTLSLSNTFPNGSKGQYYSVFLSGSGGSSPYTFQIIGSLPPGLSYSSGLISGYPTSTGTSSFSIKITDHAGCQTTVNASITITCPAISVSPNNVSGGRYTLGDQLIGQFYSQSFGAVGGSFPYTYSYSGSLPAGMTWNNSGYMSGTPTTANTYFFTVTATDAGGCTGSTDYSAKIYALGKVDGHVYGSVWKTYSNGYGGAQVSPNTGVRIANVYLQQTSTGGGVGLVSPDNNAYFAFTNLSPDNYKVVTTQMANNVVQYVANYNGGNPNINYFRREATNLIVNGGGGTVDGTVNYTTDISGANLFYHMSNLYTFFKGAPFLDADLDSPLPIGYANYVDPVSSKSDNLRIFIGPVGGVDWAQSRDAIAHEYTHIIIYRIYSGNIDPHVGGQPYTQGDAMEEGFADYFAVATKTGSTLVAPDILGGNARDISVLKKLGEGYTGGDFQGLDNHQDGLIIAGAAWDLHNAIDANQANYLIYQAMRLTPHPKDFRAFLTNLYKADNDLYAQAHFAAIKTAFDRHNIYSNFAAVEGGWNLISVPNITKGTIPADVFQSMSSPAFSYNGAYVNEAGLDIVTNRPGIGFWGKFNGPAGLPNQYFAGPRRLSASVTIRSGWNMLGALSNSVPVNTITPTPVSAFGYRHSTGGYYAAANLDPGYGYWVKFSAAGTATFNTTGNPPGTVPQPPELPPTAPDALASPVLISPMDGAQGQLLSPILYWNSVSTATTYRLQVSTSAVFGTTVYDNANLTGTSQQVGPLANGTTFYWHVMASNDLGSSVWSSTNSFQTGMPPVPSLSSPINGATNQSVSPNLVWYTSSGATLYRLQVSSSSGFTSLAYDNSNISATSQQVGTLAYNSTYYWRVNAQNSIGTSSYSSVWSFSTGSPPPPPNPCLPDAQSAMAMDQLSVTDANGNTQTLFVHNTGRGLSKKFISDDEMPPPISIQWFDARFKSNKFVEHLVDNKERTKIPISVVNAAYPLVLSWDFKKENTTSYYLKLNPKDNDNKDIPLVGKGNINLQQAGKDGTIYISAAAANPCPPNSANIPGSLAETMEGKPASYALEQNMPNPFNPVTYIRYSIPVSGRVTLKVYNVLGQEVRVLVDEVQNAGNYSAYLDAGNIPSGVYFYRLQTENFSDAKKMVLMK